MKPFLPAFALSLTLCLHPVSPSSAKADCGPAPSEIEALGYLSYGEILSRAAKAGRIYSREDTVSGAKRHLIEFTARQYIPTARQPAKPEQVISEQ